MMNHYYKLRKSKAIHFVASLISSPLIVLIIILRSVWIILLDALYGSKSISLENKSGDNEVTNKIISEIQGKYIDRFIAIMSLSMVTFSVILFVYGRSQIADMQKAVDNNLREIEKSIKQSHSLGIMYQNKFVELEKRINKKDKDINDYLADALFELALREPTDDQSIVLYTRAIEKKNNFARAYNSRGVLYLRQERFKEAIADFKRAIEFENENAVYYYNLSCSYAKRCSNVADRDAAILNVLAAAEKGFEYPEQAKTDSDLNCIRNDRRYRDRLNNAIDIMKKTAKNKNR